MERKYGNAKPLDYLGHLEGKENGQEVGKLLSARHLGQALLADLFYSALVFWF
jgi:hypothetical protein